MPNALILSLLLSPAVCLGGRAASAPPTTTPPPAGTTAPASPPSTAPPSTPVEAPATLPLAAPEPAIVELLTRLERASDDLQQFQAVVAYEKYDELTGGAELQFGRLLYVREAGATRLGVLFNEYVDAAGRSDTLEQWYVFADGWLCEIDRTRKQFIKRQIVPPGKTFDPLKLGEGPFPLPVGQRKDEVLARFEVSAAPPPEARLLKALDMAAVSALRLVPKSGTPAAEEFVRVDLYYDTATMLPVGVVAVDPVGNRKTVRLSKLVRNGGLSSEDRTLLSVETPDPAMWTVDVRPWQE